METVWEDKGETIAVTAPLSLIISAFAPVTDASATSTPQLRTDRGDTDLIYIDLGQNHNRLGASALAQVFKQVGNTAPDIEDATHLKNFFNAIQRLKNEDLLLAYHDRSDGGLAVTLAEMAFAGHCGLDIHLNGLGEALPVLFNEELGGVIQVPHADLNHVMNTLKDYNLTSMSFAIGKVTEQQQIRIHVEQELVIESSRVSLQRFWACALV